MKEKHTQGITARASSTSHNTKEITVITRKLTLTDQRAHEGNYALQQYSRLSSEEGGYQKKHPSTQMK